MRVHHSRSRFRPPCPHDATGRGVAHGARSHGIREPVQIQQVDLAVRAGCSTCACSWNCSGTCVISRSPSGSSCRCCTGSRLHRLRHGRRPAGSVVTTFPGRRVRYISAPSDHLMLAPAGCHWRQWHRHALSGTHRHCRAEGVFPRPDALQLAAAAGRSGAARASRAGRHADDRFPGVEAAARPRRVLQPDP